MTSKIRLAPMRYDFKGEIIPGTNEPLHTWEVFYWTAR